MRRLPPKTLFDLTHPAGEGDRHDQIKRLVCSLTASGAAAPEIFHKLRPNYAKDVSDEEILDLIEWASSKSFHSDRRKRRNLGRLKHTIKLAPSSPKGSAVTPEEATANAESWLNGFRADLADLYHCSPWTPPQDWRDDPLMFLAAMYHGGEYINIVSAHREGKPIGKGITKERDEWLSLAREHRMPFSEAGAWIRMNPTDGKGVADANVTAFRFALLENDKISIELQLSLLARLPLPINALALSGGKSSHAWLRVDASSAEEFRTRMKQDVFQTLARFGFDQANSNPSRLARFPGVKRQIGAKDGGEQKLLYVHPDTTSFLRII